MNEQKELKWLITAYTSVSPSGELSFKVSASSPHEAVKQANKEAVSDYPELKNIVITSWKIDVVE